MALALDFIRKEGIRLKGDVTLESVVDEEGPGFGTLGCVVKGYRAEGGIVMEPTGDGIIQIASTGTSQFSIVIRGKGAPSSTIWEAVNAIEKAMKIYQALKGLEERWADTMSYCLYPRWSPIYLGALRAGIEEATLDGKIRLLPGVTREVLKEDLEAQVERAAQNDPWLRGHPPEIRWTVVGRKSAKISEDHPMVQHLARAIRSITGKPASFEGASANDMPFLTNHARVPTVLYGPGDVRVAHASDEYVPVDNLVSCVKVLASFMLDWCGYEVEG